MNTEWLPIEINVPDTINSISSGFQNFAQQIPFINRVISQERPRPLLVFVPVNTFRVKTLQPNKPNDDFYGPYENFANKFPLYP